MVGHHRLIHPLLVLLILVAQSTLAFSSFTPRIVGYYASWTAYGGYSPDRIPGGLLTHVIYAFANISDDGRVILGDACLDAGRCEGRFSAAQTPGGSFAQMRKLKKRHPHLKILVAIGGWNWSRNFSDSALSAESRSRFVSSALELLLDQWPGLFDGFDLDWEYPVAGGLPENRYRPDDWRNYALLIAEFRRQLDSRSVADSRRYLLTVAAPASPAHAMEKPVWEEIGALVDWVNLMTYDYHTGGSMTHFNAPLFAVTDDPAPDMNVHATVQRYLAAGVPAEKITMGLPFFGHGFGGVQSDGDGLFQAAKPHSSEKEWGVGAVSFRELQKQRKPTLTRYWHPEAKVPWLFDREARIWISYDDAESIARKLDYVLSHALGGIMIWELSGDDGSLLPAIHGRLLSK